MRTSIFSILPLLAIASPAMAQDAADPPSDVTVSGNVALVSDYRFRGVSQSDNRPAVQASVTVKHANGLYAGVWGSNIDDDSIGYGSMEVDLYGGWSGEVGSGITADVGLLYYLYPDAPSGVSSDSFEAYASLSGTLGPANLKVGTNYTWGQAATGQRDNVYIYTDLSVGVPNTPVTLVAHYGYSDGAYGSALNAAGGRLFDGEYSDWSLGADYVTGPVTFGLRYIDNDLPRVALGTSHNLAKATVMGSVTYNF
ncbi:MAG: hypothetical protein IT553_11085 [Sphingomonadaceae bacterium]|nr:hypothetical protein [Sphingomonadaceae bacterium]